MVRDVGQIASGDPCAPQQVLKGLWAEIGPSVQVYPTENYFYFSFYANRKSYSGSLRLAADTRDSGVIEFNCYESFTRWHGFDSDKVRHKDLSAKDGVRVEKVGDFEYDVTFGGRTKRFVLNRLDQSPNAEKLEPSEKFVGRAFDESGIIFDLIYETGSKAFFFILDDRNPVMEVFIKIRENFYLGKRTGFLFWGDVVAHRWILIAVNADETYTNSPYDGPFDQLPENFYGSLGFWQTIYDAYPDLAGKVTPGGSIIDTDLIFAVTAYRLYDSTKDLNFIDRCLHQQKVRGKLTLCLTGEIEE